MYVDRSAPDWYKWNYTYDFGQNIRYNPFNGFNIFHAEINYYVFSVFMVGFTYLTSLSEGKKRVAFTYVLWGLLGICLYKLHVILFGVKIFEGVNPHVKYLCVFSVLYLNLISYRFVNFSKRMQRSKLAIAGRLPFFLLILSVLFFCYGLLINLFGATLVSNTVITYKEYQIFGLIGVLSVIGGGLVYFLIFSFFQILGMYDSINRGEVRRCFLPKVS